MTLPLSGLLFGEEFEDSTLADAVVLAAFLDDTRLIMSDTDFVNGQESMEEAGDLNERVDQGQLVEQANSIAGAAFIKAMVDAANGSVRLSGYKSGAYRLQPTNNNDPPEPRVILQAAKSVGMAFKMVVPPKFNGACSTRYNTYVLKLPNRRLLKFVYGKGRNNGQRFEDKVASEFNGALFGESPSPFVSKLCIKLGIKPEDLASVEHKGKSFSKRPLHPVPRNVAAEIADVIISTNENATFYLSIKNERGDTFGNTGYTGGFSEVCTEDGKFVRFKPVNHPLDGFVGTALGVNKALLADGLTAYMLKAPQHTNSQVVELDANFTLLENYIKASYGFGYHYVRNVTATGVTDMQVIDLTTLERLSDVVGAVVSVEGQYPFYQTKYQKSKQMTVKVVTTNNVYLIEIRNTKSGINPTEIKFRIAEKKFSHQL